MITLIRFEGELFLRFNTFLLKFLDFTSENCSSIDSRIDTISLDRNDNVSTSLKEIVSVKSDNTSLIGLGNIGENDINHTDEHAIFMRMTSVFNDGDDVRSLLGHVNEITTGTVREFDGINETSGTDNISNVRD